MIVHHVVNMYTYAQNVLLLNQMNVYQVGKNSRVFLTVCRVNLNMIWGIKKVIAKNQSVQALVQPHLQSTCFLGLFGYLNENGESGTKGKTSDSDSVCQMSRSLKQPSKSRKSRSVN